VNIDLYRRNKFLKEFNKSLGVGEIYLYRFRIRDGR